MSDNLDTTRRAIAAFNARDIDAFAAVTSEDFEWVPSMSPVEGEKFVGTAGVHRYFEMLDGAWEHFHVLADRVHVREELVLVLGRLEGRGRSSGADVHASLGMAFDFSRGSIARIRGFLDHDEALRATDLIE
jgi:ketosteroid isomerase-like protein